MFTGEEREYYGEQPNIHQRGYVDNLHSSGRLVLATLDDVLKYCTKKGKPEDIEKEETESEESESQSAESGDNKEDIEKEEKNKSENLAPEKKKRGRPKKIKD